MDEKEAAREKLRCIQQLWNDLQRTEKDTPEYEIISKKIRDLADEYQNLITET